MEGQIENIHTHLDWLYGNAKYDYLSTESGVSEFTNDGCGKMLAWMNETVSYSESKWGRQAFIKCHCSRGQECPDYKDPVTGGPLNFNFLPYYADKRLGIYPHTVQFYNWTQPAPTYGNTNFEYMFKFLEIEAGHRPVVYHGETAYWVNYDIDVPLFLPIYADSRLSDLRAIADGQAKGVPAILGQINFDSGWEWAYWLSDVLTASAAWNPYMEQTSQRGAMKALLAPVVAYFGAAANDLSEILLDTIDAQRDLLVYGKVNGKYPSSVVARNGQAYLEGWDTWSELMVLVSKTISTQPVKLGIQDVRNPLGTTPDYNTQVEPLLNEMETSFTSLVSRLQKLKSRVAVAAMPYYQEILDSLQITALRALQVHRLYNFASSFWTKSTQWRYEQLNMAKQALAQAIEIVKERESQYRVPLDRIAGWRSNPTVYGYGYLWTVHSLFYFWRDYAKAEDVTWEAILSPCYLNIINPVDVAFGEGIWLNVTAALYKFFDKLPDDKWLVDCLHAPPEEPVYPQDLYN